MAVDYLGRETRIIRTDSSKEYFDYTGDPRDISIDVYVKVYEKFCEAYGIEVMEDDIRNISYKVQSRIFHKGRPEGVDYNPRYHGHARLYIKPMGNGVRFWSFSYKMPNEKYRFVNLTKRYFRGIKSLEEKMDQ